jgi:hypothetical protein
MSDITYKVRFSPTTNEFEVEGDKDFVLEMIEKFEVFSAKTKNISTSISAQTSTSGKLSVEEIGKPTSVGEFVRQLNLKKHTDIVLAFGYYLEKHSGLNEFAPADINNCYYEAKLESSNTSQMIIQNIKRGFIMQSKGEHKEKRYTLTHSGIEYIESNKK